MAEKQLQDICSCAVKKEECGQSAIAHESEMLVFPAEFTAEHYVDRRLEKSDMSFDTKLNELRVKITRKVEDGRGETTILLPAGVSKAIANILIAELREKGFIGKYRKYRYRDHTSLRELKIRLPKRK